MQDALTYVVSAGREGRTWRPVANGRFGGSDGGQKREQSDLLIAFVDGEPDIAAPVADLFGNGPHESAKQFEIDAEVVCNALDGLAPRTPQSRLNLFVIREASRGQAHVDIAEQWEVSMVTAAARRWQSGGANRPPIRPLPGVEDDRCLHARAPYPGDLVRLMAWQWLAHGDRRVPCRGARLREVLDVMLRKEGVWETAARRLIETAVARTGPAIARAGNRSAGPDRALGPAVLLAADTFAVLLHALGETKEFYMHSAPFLVGRLLAAADTLHSQYCRIVRGGSVPPQLIGNALLAVAKASPAAALSRLLDRIGVYQAWATRAEGDDAGLAKWSLAELGRISRKLAEKTLPTGTSETERAELLLGYL